MRLRGIARGNESELWLECPRSTGRITAAPRITALWRPWTMVWANTASASVRPWISQGAHRHGVGPGATPSRWPDPKLLSSIERCGAVCPPETAHRPESGGTVGHGTPDSLRPGPYRECCWGRSEPIGSKSAQIPPIHGTQDPAKTPVPRSTVPLDLVPRNGIGGPNLTDLTDAADLRGARAGFGRVGASRAASGWRDRCFYRTRVSCMQGP